MNRGVKSIPFAVFGWLVSRRFAASEEREVLDLSLAELTYERGGPGRVFVLAAEALFELISQFEGRFGDRISLSSQAGERIVRLKNQPEEEWLEEYLSALPQETLAPEDVRVA